MVGVGSIGKKNWRYQLKAYSMHFPQRTLLNLIIGFTEGWKQWCPKTFKNQLLKLQLSALKYFMEQSEVSLAPASTLSLNGPQSRDYQSDRLE